MKNFKIIFVLILLLIFNSCSSDENAINQKEKTTVSFGLFLNDFTENKIFSKQTFSNIPECSDSSPAYAEIILSRNGTPVVGSADSPYQLELQQFSINGGMEVFSRETVELELEPGAYVLEYFQVYNEEGDLIWTAPVNNGTGSFAQFVNTPLPLNINIGAGVKKYVEIDVLCFDDRFVNQYGYSFFDLQGSEAIEFCIFGNYCLEDGRHAEAARYRVSVWSYSGDPENPKGTNLYSNLENSIIVTDFEDYSETAAEPLCITLPDGSGTDEYYFEIRILNFDYETEERIIRSGIITDEDVRSLFEGNDNVDYFHFREGNCAMDDSPQLFEEGDGNGVDPNQDTDGDGIADVNDNCPYQYNPGQGGLEYYGEACFDPCTIKTSERDHLAIALNQEEEFQEFTGPEIFVGSLIFLHKDLIVGSIRGRISDSNTMVVDVYIDAGRYLEDHVIEIKDDLNSESICKIIHPIQIVPGPTNSYSQFEVEIPEGFSAPYYVKFKGNLFVNF